MTDDTSSSWIAQLQESIRPYLDEIIVTNDEVTIDIKPEHIKTVCRLLRSDPNFSFEQLIDLCGVDFLHYGLDEWNTQEASTTGFERGRTALDEIQENPHWDKPRFGVVYQLLSIQHNRRLTVRSFPSGELPLIASVVDIWASANWYEREAFDLYGILFEGHPDLRRLLTDYGFIGHPFRKDFPLVGQVEMRYDAGLERVIYEPVDIEPRVLVPKIIREDNRYHAQEENTDV